MTTLTKEAEEAIQQLNRDVWDRTPVLNKLIEDNGNLFTMGSDGDECYVEFLGLCVWSSNEDPRIYNEAEDEYEPILSYLKRKANEILLVLQSLSFNP